MKDLDADEIINTVEPKIRKGLEIEGKELVFYALIPMIVDRDMEKYIIVIYLIFLINDFY